MQTICESQTFFVLSIENVNINFCCQKRILVKNDFFVVYAYFQKKKRIGNLILMNRFHFKQQFLIISQALQNPCLFFGKLTEEIFSNYLKQLSVVCECDFEKQINEQLSKFELLEQILLKIKEELREKLKEYKQTQVQLNKFRDELLEQSQYNTILQLIVQLKELDKQYQSDQYVQIEKKLISTLNDIIKDNSSQIRQQLNKIQEKHFNLRINLSKPNTEQFQKQITELFKQYEKFIDNLNSDFCSYIPSLEQMVDQIISLAKKQVKQKKLIYQGSTDGLNANSFWNKVNGRRNLLIICKSQSNQIFGGYSPCQWDKEGGNRYIQDETQTSFLFSQTKNLIFPQHIKSSAIYCRSDYGPTFGGGHDIQISADFQGGYSNLGHTYTLDQQYQSQKTTLLFGEITPKVIECEIYELILQ